VGSRPILTRSGGRPRALEFGPDRERETVIAPRLMQDFRSISGLLRLDFSATALRGRGRL